MLKLEPEALQIPMLLSIKLLMRSTFGWEAQFLDGAGWKALVLGCSRVLGDALATPARAVGLGALVVGEAQQVPCGAGGASALFHDLSPLQHPS